MAEPPLVTPVIEYSFHNSTKKLIEILVWVNMETNQWVEQFSGNLSVRYIEIRFHFFGLLFGVLRNACFTHWTYINQTCILQSNEGFVLHYVSKIHNFLNAFVAHQTLDAYCRTIKRVFIKNHCWFKAELLIKLLIMKNFRLKWYVYPSIHMYMHLANFKLNLISSLYIFFFYY